MAIASSHNKHVYSGNGVTTEWPYGFRIIDATDIKVYITNNYGAVNLISIGYSVDLDASCVTYPAIIDPEAPDNPPILPAGWRITLLRDIPLTQELDLQNQGTFYAEVIEQALDKIMMVIQQLDERLVRSVQVPVDSTESAADLLPSIISSVSTALTAAVDAQTYANGAGQSAASAHTYEINAQAYANSINPATFNAVTATKLKNARTISLTGNVTGSATFDGSDNASITATVANDSHTHTSATVPPGGIGGYQLFTTSGTFTVPTGVTSVYVTMCGGGGGGGGGDGGSWVGAGGGGGGSYVNKQLTVTPGTGYTITIGAGGAGGARNANGSAGGSTSFGALLTAGGGGGGTNAVSPTGGSAGTGDFKGRAGVYGSMDTTGVKSGGDSLFGFGGMTYGAPGTGYGGGGNGQTSGSGGAGSPGFAIIMW